MQNGLSNNSQMVIAEEAAFLGPFMAVVALVLFVGLVVFAIRWRMKKSASKA